MGVLSTEIQRKWQATWCSPRVAWVVAGRVPSAGTVVAQIGWAIGQRVWKRQPAGGVGGPGGAPPGTTPTRRRRQQWVAVRDLHDLPQPPPRRPVAELAHPRQVVPHEKLVDAHLGLQ